MPMFLKVSMQLDTGAVADFALRVRAHAGNIAPALQVVAENLRAHEAAGFDSEGATFLGRMWVALAPATVRARLAHRGAYAAPSAEGGAHRILQWTGRLRRSLTEADHPEHVETITPDSLTFGTRVPYAIYHHSPAPRRRLPRRPVLGGITREFVLRQVVPPIQQYVLGRDPRSGQQTRRVFRTPFTPIQGAEAAD